ncbi:cation diffusion facilitator family transporter [Corynebacterium mycetoides]|uniref:Cation diffusion facilitator family transporter n=1 Tax=Corynebacterium mycetoides TaxID=38302 RepID=A0A1G9PXG0_9CORY|nr:cation diffusion facilitator family transporter [Corynebacterium mycetoides]SDM03434.1 cation diffusion facilitator family transporter [Corynebacterium mycetoides]
MARVDEASTGTSIDALPKKQGELLHKAVQLEWISLAVLTVTVALVGIVSGQSQAMKAAWYEDLLSLLPPIAFLVATRVIRRNPDAEHPFGHHRAIGVGHVVAGSALLAMGAFLLGGSAVGLVNQEKPPIGTVVLFGSSIWLGWLMVAVMALSVIGPVILGRLKLKIAEPLQDKVLYADADMNKADWMTGVATIVGVLGVGIGLWWMDAVAAIVVSFSIVWDGVNNLRTAVRDLTDARPTDLDGNKHPVLDKAVDAAQRTDWVKDASARFRDLGHVLHAEVFVVPREGREVSVDKLRELRQKVEKVDYQLHDVVVTAVSEIPEFLVKEER